MPIWFELMVLMLVTYVIGLGIGWALWGRGPANDAAPDVETAAETDGETN